MGTTPPPPTIWNDHHVIVQAIRKVFGDEIEIFIPKKQQQQQQQQHLLVQSCHLGFSSAQDAQRALQAFQGVVVTWECEQGHALKSQPLFLDYATITQKSKAKQLAKETGKPIEKGQESRPECTTTTDHVHVPGLVVIENYLTQAQEQVLMAVLTGPQAPWAKDQIK
jgi:hypothetical protein